MFTREIRRSRYSSWEGLKLTKKLPEGQLVSAKINESAQAERPTEGTAATEEVINENSNDDSTVTQDEQYEDSDSEIKAEPNPGH